MNKNRVPETWIPDPDNPGYEFSSKGNARSIDRTVTCSNGKERFYKGKLLKQAPTSTGYLTVKCADHGVNKTVKVHVAVCRLFHGPKPHPDWHACHGASGKLVNTAENIYWASPSRNNNEDKRRDGSLSNGERHGKSRFTESEVLKIRRFREQKMSPQKIADIFGVSRSAVDHIIYHRTWKHV